MNSTVSTSTLDNKYWKVAFEKSLPRTGRERHSFEDHVQAFAEKLDKLTRVCMAGGIGGLQMDGVKDVAKNKLLATVIMLDETPLLYELFDTDLTKLSEESFMEHFKRLFTELDSKGYFQGLPLRRGC